METTLQRLPWLKPLLRTGARFVCFLPLAGFRNRYRRLLDSAGLQVELSADEFLSLKFLGLLSGLGLGLLIHLTVVESWLLVVGPAFLAFIYPDIHLSARTRKYRQACLRALPGFLDLLALGVEAGLGFDSAVRKLTELLEPGPLVWTFQSFLRSMNVGKTRAEALREAARKLDLPEFTAFTNAVIQATELGASISSVLKNEAQDILFRRFERAERAALELPVKIIFPLFAFIFPATFLMILGPLYFQFQSSGVASLLGR